MDDHWNPNVRCWHLIFIFLLTLIAVSKLWGQATEFGAVNGTVTDPVGHLIVAVTVTATNTATS